MEPKSTVPALLLNLSNIPTATEKTHRFFTWKHSNKTPSWRTIQDYANGYMEHPFITFLGQVGTGKTHLALAIGWEWLEQGRTVLYYQAASFLDSMRDALRRGQSNLYTRDKVYEEIVAFARNASLFILDDLGAERATEWAMEQLDEIIDFRYINRKPLIVTSNLTLDDLPARIADRLREGVLILLKGKSYRGKR